MTGGWRVRPGQRGAAIGSRFWLFVDRRDLIVLFGIVLLAWLVQTFFFNYTVDDAFISFRYSQNLARGMGLVFNPGERVEGYTNFLWTLWCAIPFLAKVDVLLFAKLSLMLLSAGCIVLTYFLFRRLQHWVRSQRAVPCRFRHRLESCRRCPWQGQGCISRRRLPLSPPPRWLAFVPAGLVALHTSFTVYAVNGIETVLFCFLLLLGANLAVREYEHGGWLSAIVFGLLFYTRPEGLLFFGLFWLGRLGFGRRDRSLWLGLLVFGLMAAMLQVFRLAYFGSPLPNTYYAKAAGRVIDRVLTWGIRYFRDIAKSVPNWPYLLLPLVGFFFWRRLPGPGRVLLLVPYLYLGYVLYIGGDVNFPYYRFLLHVLPLLAVVAVLSFAGRTPAPVLRTRQGVGPGLALAFAVMLAVAQLANTAGVWRELNATPESPRFRYLSTMPLAGHISIYPGIAARLREVCPPGSTVVMQDVGAIPFYSGVRTFDIIGLVNGPLARYFHRMKYSDYLLSRLPVELIAEVDQWVCDRIIEEEQAEFVLYHVDAGDTALLHYSFHFHGLAFDPRFRLLYEPIEVFSYPNTGRADHVLFRRMN